ncbi:MAG: TolC family protein [Candidatus Hydrogenedentes bacterium]|nr:TolC family protein [Candidatus Hydrogenedentota bacterium]
MVNFSTKGKLLCILILAFLFLFSACSKYRYKASADRETLQIIKEKSSMVPGMLKDFSIEETKEYDPYRDLPEYIESDPAFGLGGEPEKFYSISLEKALEIAINKNREYLTKKESVYLSALSLSLERYYYGPIFTSKHSATVTQKATEISVPSEYTNMLEAFKRAIPSIQSLTGASAQLLNEYHSILKQAGDIAGWTESGVVTVDNQSLASSLKHGVSILFLGGGRLAIQLTNNFLRFLSGGTTESAQSVLSASFTQPLWRGRGRLVSAENLTQAERNVLYDLRDFTRYRQEFVVDICKSYFSVLQQRDIVKNNYQSYLNFKKSFERESAFAQEGRKTLTEIGRIQQALLTAEDTWINSLRRYKESLDEFKITLGLSTDSPIMLDPKELERIKESGVAHPKLPVEDAVEIALVTRLDLYNQRDSIEDALRKIKVAENALKPGLDLVFEASVSNRGKTNFESLDPRRGSYSGGINLDIPFSQKERRNAYRISLINYERAKRDLSLAEDKVKMDVRTAWRNLEQARRNYEIALQSVELSKRRVEEQNLLAELGRATALDLVDAQNDLTRAQNNLTSALVSHYLAKLDFWKNIGILYVKENGQWEEIKDVY